MKIGKRKRKDCFIRVWVMWDIKPSKRRRWGGKETKKKQGENRSKCTHTHGGGEARVTRIVHLSFA
jgi:hypothetical protein